MTLTDFRKYLDAWWVETDDLEMVRKNSQGSLLAFMDLYEGLGVDERELADRVIAEWIGSDNSRKRFDALAMVDHFLIRVAVAQLKREEAALAAGSGNDAPYELAKVRRILRRFDAEIGVL